LAERIVDPDFLNSHNRQHCDHDRSENRRRWRFEGNEREALQIERDAQPPALRVGGLGV